MPRTLSGHDAITSPTDRRLAVAKVPGRPVSLRVARPYLPLFLRLAVLLDQVIQLRTMDTWSYAYRAPRMGSGVSDHAGYAIDCWSAREGAATWPTRMSREQAERIAAVLSQFRTADGRYVFGWGASRTAPGVAAYKGPTYSRAATNDPMHFFIAPGITPADALAVRRAMGIRPDGTIA